VTAGLLGATVTADCVGVLLEVATTGVGLLVGAAVDCTDHGVTLATAAFTWSPADGEHPPTASASATNPTETATVFLSKAQSPAIL
jgi:hypothetical protein